MIKLSHAMMALLSGLVWMVVGCFLMPLGFKLLLKSEPGPVIEVLAPYLGGAQQVALLFVALGLFVGYMKGRHVLGKSAVRGVERIKNLPNPSSLAKIYTPAYYILLGSMIFLGMSIKYFGVPNDIRGFVDVAVGSALIQGSMVYFQFSINSWRQLNHSS